ncbi:hypothetical protein CROQUDRAFT_304598 [Cronartium quercuum f. sp. fusiforme G11]|uniref:Uncharacterized protein n=1 Tax=Cronartium quercuum f. sp. fusiforme G11 TaxID=708437 RepID=A0A9P6N8B8_9BASI|nr:hypothetical protein CROQUDRAFT_304598 [Cronartium quercuum f. sp. fusiforme G11]
MGKKKKKSNQIKTAANLANPQVARKSYGLYLLSKTESKPGEGERRIGDEGERNIDKSERKKKMARKKVKMVVQPPKKLMNKVIIGIRMVANQRKVSDPENNFNEKNEGERERERERERKRERERERVMRERKFAVSDSTVTIQ